MKRNVLILLASCPMALAACSAENENLKTETPTRAVTGTLNSASLEGLSRIVAIDTRDGAYDGIVDANGSFAIDVPVGRSVVMYVLDEALKPVREVQFDAGGAARTSILPVAGAPAGASDDSPVSLGAVQAVAGSEDEAECEDSPLEDVDSDDDGIDNLKDEDDDGDDVEDEADEDDDGDELDDDADFEAVADEGDDADLDGVEDDADEDDDDGPGAGRGRGQRREHHEDEAADDEDDDADDDADDDDADEHHGEEGEDDADDDEHHGEEGEDDADDDESEAPEADEDEPADA
jgi:hypothetical protein